MEFIILLITPLVAALISFFVRAKRNIIEAVTLCAVSLEMASTVSLGARVVSQGEATYSSALALNSLSVLFACVVALIGCAVTLYSIGYLREETRRGVIGISRVRQFYALLNLLLFSMFAGIVTTHPVLVWISVEATTLSTVFLISFYGKSTSVEAAWKFFIINSIALLLGFLGTLLFMATPAVFENTWFMKEGVTIDPMLIKIAFILVLIGYGTKTGFAPLHTWLPDAHGMAPAPISGLLSGALLNVSFLALLRFKALVDPLVGVDFSQTLFLVFGVFSVIIAALLIYSQHNYKRLLAYSSVEHMGIMALGFGAGGAGIYASLLHMIYHAITKTLLFLASGNILLKFGTAKIKNIKGIGRALPITTALFFMGLLSITAMPPFGIFFTEFSILSALMYGSPIIAGCVLAALALVFVGAMKHISSMMSGESPQGVTHGESNAWTVAPLFGLALLLGALSMGIPPALHSLLIRAAEIFSSI